MGGEGGVGGRASEEKGESMDVGTQRQAGRGGIESEASEGWRKGNMKGVREGGNGRKERRERGRGGREGWSEEKRGKGERGKNKDRGREGGRRTEGRKERCKERR